LKGLRKRRHVSYLLFGVGYGKRRETVKKRLRQARAEA